MISLYKNIKEQYGIEALKQLHLWEKSVWEPATTGIIGYLI